MKLIRFGELGNESPGLQLDDGRVVDTSSVVNDYNEEFFGSDGLKQLVQMMKTMKSSKNDQTVTLLVDPRAKKVTNILPAGYASISNEAFIDFAEGYINQYGLDVKDFG